MLVSMLKRSAYWDSTVPGSVVCVCAPFERYGIPDASRENWWSPRISLNPRPAANSSPV